VSRDRVLIYYDPSSGLNYLGNCHVVLRDSVMVAPAVVELNNAALFNKRIKLEPISSDWVPSLPKAWRVVDLARGWFASEKPDIELAKVREPLMVYPKDLFAPLRGKKSQYELHVRQTLTSYLHLNRRSWAQHRQHAGSI